jgi:hypothetical protein
MLGLLTISEIRQRMQDIIHDGMRLSSLPQYLNGLILALSFAPRISLFLVEVLTEVFAKLPDNVLLPWLPSLILKLRSHKAMLYPLISEAASQFPKNLKGFADWQPQWLQDAPTRSAETANDLSDTEKLIRKLLMNAPETTNAFAQQLGVSEIRWEADKEE